MRNRPSGVRHTPSHWPTENKTNKRESREARKRESERGEIDESQCGPKWQQQQQLFFKQKLKRNLRTQSSTDRETTRTEPTTLEQRVVGRVGGRKRKVKAVQQTSVAVPARSGTQKKKRI